MFTSLGIRSWRGRFGVSNGMFNLLILSAFLICFLSWILILSNYESFNLAGINNQLFKVSKRFFISGNGSASSANSNGYYQYSTNPASSPNAGFSYKSAVAYQPKDRDDPIYKTLKASLESPTGEDNFFIRVNYNNDVYAGVADGVGGWASHGFDSSAISRELCKAMSQFSELTNNPKLGVFNEISPKELINASYNKIKDENLVEVGGSTAIVAHFPPTGTMTVANLGDSWCGVFRDYQLVFETKFQTVGFNAPYQLAIIPEKMAKEAKRTGNSYIENSPSDADEYSFQLAKNDIVILATDGVTDNIATGDMENFFRDNEMRMKEDLEGVTKEFIKNVVTLSKDPEFPSVFAQELSRLSGKQYSGGKEDDITAVVIKVE